MSGGLHRRTSSAALHYSSLPGNDGQDISLFTSSASNPRSSRAPAAAGGGSSSHHSTVSVTVTPEEGMEGEEEKDSLLADSPRMHHRQPATRTRRRTSKCRILFLLMVLASTSIILYAVVTGWIEKRDVEKVWGDWKGWAKQQQENWGSASTSATLASELAGGQDFNSSDASSIEALLAAKGRPQQSSSVLLTDKPSTSGESAATSRPPAIASTSQVSASNVTYGSFANSRMTEINGLVDLGNLSVYTWHATLPTLASTSAYSSTHQNQSRRLIIVGDVHGTHRSLFRLLRRIAYTPSHDTLLHTGDVLAKSTIDNSLATIQLLRKLGAKGVRGNHDQKVLEWRKWMEALGPLDQQRPRATDLGDAEQAGEGSTKTVEEARFGEAQGAVGRVGSYQEAPRKWYDQQESRAMRQRSTAPAPRRNKRDWLSWLSAHQPEEETESTEEDILETGFEREDEYLASADSDEAEANSASSIAKTSGSTRPSDRRRPFGQRPARLSTSATPTSARLARPTSLPTTSSLSTVANTTLLGPLYAHLDPSLTTSQRAALGIQVPTAWEWGGQHFEIARRLSKEDVEYLESLPMTLWVQELNSFIVHAGLVPWTPTPKEILAPLSSSSSGSTLRSTSEASFVPDSKTYRSLASSLGGSLLLVPQNTDPFTLLNLRTLSLVRPASSSSHTEGKVRVKGPASEWKVSSKSHRASKHTQPWWSVWESGIRGYEKENGDDETVGIVYGHWASQGLQVQEHSIGLDTGCVYGRKLSAMVLDLSRRESQSPLASTASPLAVNASDSSPTPISHAPSNSIVGTSPSSSQSVKARPALEQGGRFDRIVKGSASSYRESSLVLGSTQLEAAPNPTSASVKSVQDDESVGDKPWWKPWKRSVEGEDDVEDSEGDEEASFEGFGEEAEEAYTTDLRKRAPPQFRPLGGIDQAKILSAAAIAASVTEDADESSTISVSTSSASPSTTTSGPVEKHKKHPQQKFGKHTSSLTPPASSSKTTAQPGRSRTAESIPSPSSSTNLVDSQRIVSSLEQDEDEEDDTEASSTVASGVRVEVIDEEEEDPESHFAAQEAIFKPLGSDRKVWIVSVDCGAEVEMDTE